MRHHPTYMRLTSIQATLQKIVDDSQTELSERVQPPFLKKGSNTSRNYDKIISVGGLTLFIEAQLGTKKKEYFFESTPELVLVTPEDQQAYEQAIYGDRKAPTKGTFLEEYGGSCINSASIPSVQGPLVDSADDTRLETIRVQAILVQYTGFDLTRYLEIPVWNRFITEQIIPAYDLRIESKSNGISDEAYERTPPGIINLREEVIESRAPIVLSKEVRDVSQIGRIFDVYQAGKITKHAIETVEQREVEKLVKEFFPYLG